jgi:hypothetical protein
MIFNILQVIWTDYWLFFNQCGYTCFTSKDNLYQYGNSCCKKSFLSQGSSDNLANAFVLLSVHNC